jgi:hypothetical protein
MPADRALILFLLGMLAYRAIDLAALNAKLEQALCRARRVTDRLPADINLRRILRTRRTLATALEPREFWKLTLWCRAAQFLSREFPIFLMYGCVLIFLLLGLSLIATHDNRSENVDRTILAVTTLTVSLVISLVALLLERFRLLLEKV